MGLRIPTEDSSPSVSFESAVAVVLEALADVPEFRKDKGRQIELRGALGLAVLAMMAGKTTYREMETWGKLREKTLAPLLGLSRAPSDSTIRRIVQGCAADSIRGVLRLSARTALDDKRKLIVAKDGKTMRACRIEDRRSAHIVSTVEVNTGVIMDAECCRVGEGELTASRRLDPGAGILVETADALYSSTTDAKRTVEGGGEYVVKVKKTRRTCSKRSKPASSPTRPSQASAAPAA